MSREHEIWNTKGHANFLERVWGGPEHERGRHWEFIGAVAELIRSQSILDVGCGMGHLFQTLRKKKGDFEYLGIDNSIEMLKKAHGFFPDKKDIFVQGDAYDLSRLPMFDSVIAVSLFMHLPEIEKPLRQMWDRAREEVIFTARLARKAFLHKRQYSGPTKLPEGKYLIVRAEQIEHYFTLFGRLEELGKVEVFYYDPRASIFRLSKGIPKYGSFRGGWEQ